MPSKRMNLLKFIKPFILALAILAAPLADKPIQAAPEEAIVPGILRTDATFEHLGALWWVTGDSDHDSAMTLEFRKTGESAWHAGAPAVRAYPTIIVDGSPLNLNYWAASAMFLQPGQTYELRLSLTDPDGGSDSRIVTAATRASLQPDPAGRQLFVAPGNGGGDGSSAHPFLGLQAAAGAAQPGDIFHVAAGAYSPFQLLHSGSAGHPIVFSGPETGVVVIDGTGTDRGIVTLGEYNQEIGYIIVERFTIQNGTWGVDAQNSHDILLSHNHLTNVDNGVINRRGNGQEYNQTISDNIIEGKTPWPGTGIPEEEGIDLRGSGNVVAFNTVRHFGDCISVVPQTGPSYGNDVIGNDVSYCVDDGIEIDYNQANARAYRNRVMNSRMGVSVQPVRGGPAYIFRNEFFNLESDPIKMHNDTTGFWVVHNTSAKNDNGQGDGGAMWRNTTYRNNLMLGTAYAFEFTTSPDEGYRDFDYDAWGTTRAVGGSTAPYFKWNNIRYNRLPNLIAAGVEVHGAAALFSHLLDAALPASWDISAEPGSRDLRLAPGAPEIDSGVNLPNLNDPYVADGKPDMGAFELGQALPAYGPRPILPELSLSSKQVSDHLAAPGQAITYTITLRNTGSLAAGAQITDTLPSGLNYSGGLWASSGSPVFSAGRITWTGDISSGPLVTITFEADVSSLVSTTAVINNTALIDDGAGHVLQRSAMVIVDGFVGYFPLTRK